MNKIIFIDTETGGVNIEKSALIQLSGIRCKTIIYRTCIHKRSDESQICKNL